MNWMPIESAPMDEDLLVYVDGAHLPYRIAMKCRYAGGEHQWITPACDRLNNGAPTHWMPLPPPPEAES